MKKENNEKGKELLRVKHKAVNYIQNPAGYNLEQLQHVLSDVAGHFKSVTGVSNNAAWLMCLDALDVLKKHPNYKGRVKYEFKRVYEAYRKYEHKLLYATAPRFFHVEDFTEETMKRYKEGLTDREYYDFWCSLADATYQRTRKGIVTVLMHKYKKSLDAHNVPHSDILQYALLAQACLVLSVKVYASLVRQASKVFQLPPEGIKAVFDPFCMKDISNAWYRAINMLEPKTEEYSLEPSEERNIQLGLIQLEEEWASYENFYNSAIESVKEYDEVFKSSKEQKKAVKEIKRLLNETGN